jgi:hypothetical protein
VIPRELKLDAQTCEPELPVIQQSYSMVKKELKVFLLVEVFTFLFLNGVFHFEEPGQNLLIRSQ